MAIAHTIFSKLFNLPSESMPLVSEWHLQFRAWNAVGWVMFLATVFGVLAFLSYRRAGRHVSTVPRYTLAAIRTLFLLMLLSLLLRPVLRFTLEGSIRRAMLVLVDGSQSMVTPEKRLEEPDLKRAAIAKDLLDPTKGLAQPADHAKIAAMESVTRLDLMKAVLNNSRLDLLNRLSKDYDLRPFQFGAVTTELAATKADPTDKSAPVSKPGEADHTFINKLKADAPITPLGDAIKELLGRSRGQPLAGIFILTDGQSNTGSSVQAAAELARQSGVPLYVYGVGISQPKDIAVASIFSQDICFVDDEVPVTVRLRSTNLAGHTGKVQLKLGDQVVDTKDVELADDGEQVAQLQFTPKKPGDYDLSALVDPLPEEANRTNNSDSKKIRVIDGKIKVLLVEQYPRWEFKYLQVLLARDRRVLLKTYLVEADKAVEDMEGSPYLKQFPAGKKDLIDAYDLVILGDIDPRTLAASQLNDLSDFVNKFGGGLILLPGKRFGADSWRGTAMEKLMPVEIDSTRKTLRGADTVADRPIKLEVTPAGDDSPMLRLSDKAEDSKKIWAKLPPIYWDAIVSRAKPGATVLMVDPDPAKAGRSGKMPVIAMQQYGLGQVLYVGTDNTWRWRKNAADKYHATMWGQMVQRLSLPHLLGESKRTQLSADKKKYAVGDKVTIFARLYTDTFDAVMEKSVAGSYQAVGGHAPVPVLLRPMPEQPGLYRGEFIAPEPGAYNFSVERDPKEKLTINIDQPRLELGETALNEALLKEIAGVTNGGYFREEDLYKLPDSTTLKTERVKSKLEVDIWSSPAYFLMLLLLVTIEWVGRKIVQLR